jgi:hypothetical protein
MKIIKLIGICVVLGSACMGKDLVFSNIKDDKLTGFMDITFVYPWVKQGKVLFQNLRTTSVDYGILLYMDKDGKWHYLRCQPEAINLMLASEVEKEGDLDFLSDEKTVAFFKTMFSDPAISSNLITNHFIGSRSADEKKLLQKYNMDRENLTIRENNWIIDIYVETKSGAIENWTISGTVTPLAVGTFSKTLIAPSGTVKETIHVGGV